MGRRLIIIEERKKESKVFVIILDLFLVFVDLTHAKKGIVSIAEEVEVLQSHWKVKTRRKQRCISSQVVKEVVSTYSEGNQGSKFDNLHILGSLEETEKL